MKTDSSGKLWILEDQAELRTIVAHLARGEGFEVVELESLVQAWVALDQEVDPGPDFIISDLRLQEEDAETWIFRSRERFPRARIACVSGSLDEAIVRRFAQKAIIAIEKPVSLLQVIQLLRMAM